MSSIFKYFGDRRYLDKFQEEGEVYFNSLSFFMSCEDLSRRDETEDTCIYKPKHGLGVHNRTSQNIFKYSGQINSKVKSPERVFVFCASGENSLGLYSKFLAQGCVEIFDVQEFTRRLHSRIKEMHSSSQVKNDQLLSGFITYFSSESEPGTRHACPDQIIMSKLDHFKDEAEYRFAFALDENAFAVNNVDYSLSQKPIVTPCRVDHRILRLGSLLDVCKVIST